MTNALRASAALFLLAAGSSFPASVSAQAGGRAYTIYGNDKCPTNAQGEEIVVCVRKDERERFRIPDELRQTETTPANEAWSDRAAAVDMVSRDAVGGPGSCSNVGGGAGATGCYVKSARRDAAVKEKNQENVANSPVPQ